jgi:hypothetical protein
MVNWKGLGRAMARLTATTYVHFHQATSHAYDPCMPIVVVGAILGGIALVRFSPGVQSLSGELAIAGSACYLAVLAIALPCPQTSGSTTRSRAGPCSARLKTGRPLVRVGFAFTFSALFFHFRDWPATFSLVL